MKKRILALLLVLCLCVSMGAAVRLSDVPDTHWAQAQISELAELSILQGYPDGTFGPDKSITKAEFIALLNRTFGMTRTETLTASDADSGKWYYNDLRKAQAGGFLFTTGGKALADAKLTREEAAAMLAAILGLTPEGTAGFTDDAAASAWAKGYIAAARTAGVVNGYPDGSFRPRATITRAEVCCLLCNVMGTVYSVSTPSVTEGNLTVRTGNVSLSHVTVKGNLYIAASSGTVSLTDCMVEGQIVLLSSGGCTVAVKNMDNLTVRGNWGTVLVRSGMDSLTVGASVNLRANTCFTLQLAQNITVNTLTLYDCAAVTGNATVTHALLHADGVNMENAPAAWTLDAGLHATLGGETVTASGTRKPAFTSGYPTAALTVQGDGLTLRVDYSALQSGSIYCICVARDSTAPTAAQVKAMTEYAGVPLAARDYAFGGQAYWSGSFTFTGLAKNSAYDVYLVAGEEGGALGKVVKLQPSVQIFTEGYPTAESLSGDTAEVLVKTQYDAEVYWAVVQHNSAAPTAAMLLNQGGRANTKFGKTAVAANVGREMNFSALTGGAAGYDVYFLAVSTPYSPAVSPAYVSLANAGNQVSVTYSSGSVCTTLSTVTLTFSGEQFLATTGESLSSAGNDAFSDIRLTAVGIQSGASAAADYSISFTSASTMVLTPSDKGWSTDTLYSLDLSCLRDAQGRQVLPSVVEFAVGDNKATQTPVFNLTNGASVTDGSIITVTSAGATIRYTTDGSDPITGNTLISSSPARIVVPENASGTFTVRAVAVSGTSTSTAAVLQVSVESDAGKVYPLRGTNGALLSTGMTVQSGTDVTFFSLTANAVYVYTLDGTAPKADGGKVTHGTQGSGCAIAGTAGANVTLKAAILSNGVLGPVCTYVYTIGTDGNAAIAAPLAVLSSKNAPCGAYAAYTVSSGQSLLLYSLNDSRSACIFYTLDGSDPRISANSRVTCRYTGTGQPVELPYAALSAAAGENGVTQVRCVVFYDGTYITAGFSTELCLELTIR